MTELQEFAGEFLQDDGEGKELISFLTDKSLPGPPSKVFSTNLQYKSSALAAWILSLNAGTRRTVLEFMYVGPYSPDVVKVAQVFSQASVLEWLENDDLPSPENVGAWLASQDAYNPRLGNLLWTHFVKPYYPKKVWPGIQHQRKFENAMTATLRVAGEATQAARQNRESRNRGMSRRATFDIARSLAKYRSRLSLSRRTLEGLSEIIWTNKERRVARMGEEFLLIEQMMAAAAENSAAAEAVADDTSQVSPNAVNNLMEQTFQAWMYLKGSEYLTRALSDDEKRRTNEFSLLEGFDIEDRSVKLPEIADFESPPTDENSDDVERPKPDCMVEAICLQDRIFRLYLGANSDSDKVEPRQHRTVASLMAEVFGFDSCPRGPEYYAAEYVDFLDECLGAANGLNDLTNVALVRLVGALRELRDYYENYGVNWNRCGVHSTVEVHGFVNLLVSFIEATPSEASIRCNLLKKLLSKPAFNTIQEGGTLSRTPNSLQRTLASALELAGSKEVDQVEVKSLSGRKLSDKILARYFCVKETYYRQIRRRRCKQETEILDEKLAQQWKQLTSWRDSARPIVPADPDQDFQSFADFAEHEFLPELGRVRDFAKKGEPDDPTDYERWARQLRATLAKLSDWADKLNERHGAAKNVTDLLTDYKETARKATNVGLARTGAFHTVKQRKGLASVLIMLLSSSAGSGEGMDDQLNDVLEPLPEDGVGQPADNHQCGDATNGKS